MRQNKLVSLRYMRPTCSTITFSRIAIVKHRLTFVAESPISLCGWCPWNIVRDGIVTVEISICFVASACRTTPFFPIPIKNHRLALGAAAPILLRGGGAGSMEWKEELVSLSDVGSARCTAIGASARVKQDLAFIAEAPTRAYWCLRRGCPTEYTHYSHNEDAATIL